VVDPYVNLKPKDLVGIPWRLAFALQADGWYLRSDIIWSKPNPMPESVTDRPTKAHEYLFLLTRSPGISTTRTRSGRECGAPWERKIERGELVGKDRGGNYRGREDELAGTMTNRNHGTPGLAYENKTVGWKPTCEHGRIGNETNYQPAPCTVLDIFMGSGTTALVRAQARPQVDWRRVESSVRRDVCPEVGAAVSSRGRRRVTFRRACRVPSCWLYAQPGRLFCVGHSWQETHG
jgi:hypothetical protein